MLSSHDITERRGLTNTLAHLSNFNVLAYGIERLAVSARFSESAGPTATAVLRRLQCTKNGWNLPFDGELEPAPQDDAYKSRDQRVKLNESMPPK